MINPASASFLGLIAIQIAIGLIYKLSQTHGTYDFSPASALAIAEAIKLCMSCVLFARTEVDLHGNDHLPLQFQNIASGNHFIHARQISRRLADHLSRKHVLRVLSLAGLYAGNNHLAFALFQLADPGTIQLVKSGSTLISAGMSWILLHRYISAMHWIAIVLQICGLLVTQYKAADASLNFPLSTYALLLMSTTITAAAGCWNEKLCKGHPGSIHATNIILYSGGTTINVLLFILRSNFDEEKGFFEGYNNIAAIGVIFLNACIGIVITMVYKYADNIIKCVATSISTAVLIIVSAVFFGAASNLLTYTGATTVLIGSYIYMTQNQRPKPVTEEAEPIEPLLGSDDVKKPARKNIKSIKRRRICISVSAAALTIVVAILLILEYLERNPHVEYLVAKLRGEDRLSGCARVTTMAPDLSEGWWKDVLVVVNWNHDTRYSINYERFNAIYAMFFPNIVHYGPGLRLDCGIEHSVDTHIDPFSKDGLHSYHSAYLAMKRAPEFRGYLWVNFDVFINVPRLQTFDKDRVWYQASSECAYRALIDNSHSKWPWWGKRHIGLSSCAKALDFVPPKWKERTFARASGGVPCCWACASDAFYIPSTQKENFFKLVEIFANQTTFLEIAVPTMIELLDDYRPRQPWQAHYKWGGTVSSHDVREISQVKKVDIVHPVSLKGSGVDQWQKLLKDAATYTTTQPSAGEAFAMRKQ